MLISQLQAVLGEALKVGGDINVIGEVVTLEGEDSQPRNIPVQFIGARVVEIPQTERKLLLMQCATKEYLDQLQDEQQGGAEGGAG